MTDKLFENNQVTMMGEIVSAFQFSHEVFGEGFYMVELAVSRLSNYSDYIPLMVSERLIDTEQDYTGQFIRISGQFRSYNRHEEKKNRLVLSVFVRELEFLDEIDENEKTNQIFLDGYICKEPIYRKTPLGREIADVLLAVNRSYGKVRLHTMHLLGQKCTVCLRVHSGMPHSDRWAGCRAGNMSNGSVRKKWSTGWHTKYL